MEVSITSKTCPLMNSLIRPKHFEQDMSWLRVGVAVRTAIDINLHRVALLSQAREGLPTWLLRSIIRTWLMSYVIDRTLSAQLGKPSSMRGENSINEYMKLLKESEEKPTAEDLSVAAWAVSFIACLRLHPKNVTHGPGMDTNLSANRRCFPE